MGKLKVRKIKKSHKICKTKWGGMEIKKNKQETSHDLYLTGRSCPRLNSPRLKGYSPGFTAGSCDAEIPEDWAVVDDSVLDVFMAERVKCGLGWVASNEERDKAQSCNCTYMSQQFKLALMIILCTFSHFNILTMFERVYASLHRRWLWYWRIRYGSGSLVGFGRSGGLRAAFGHSCERKMGLRYRTRLLLG